jgi:hypothetical protein
MVAMAVSITSGVERVLSGATMHSVTHKGNHIVHLDLMLGQEQL